MRPLEEQEPDMKEVAVQALTEIFPKEPFSLHETFGGVSTNVYRIQFASGKTSFMRIAEAGDSFWVEKQVHELLGNKGIPVPSVELFEERNGIVDRSIMITSSIPGVTIETLRNKGQQCTNKALFEIGNQLAHINSIPFPGFEKFLNKPEHRHFETRFTSYTEYCDYKLKDHGSYLIEAGIITPEEQEKITRVLNEVKSKQKNPQTVLCHGDMDVSNLMMSEGKFTGFIDFSDAGAGTRSYDLAYIKLKNPAYYDAILEGYRASSHFSGFEEDFTLDLYANMLKIGLRKLVSHSKRDALKVADHYFLQFLREEFQTY